MKCHQCGHNCKVKFKKDGKVYCSSTCVGVKPKEEKRKRFGGFEVVEDKFVFVDAGVEAEDMPAHYIMDAADPVKVAKAHKKKVTEHYTREALKREFSELRSDK